MDTISRLTTQLRNISQLTQQVEQVIISSATVQATHPARLAQAEKWMQMAYDEIRAVKEEDEVATGYWQEVEESFPVILDRLANAMTVQQNLDFIQATDKANLKRFLLAIIQYGLPLLVEVYADLNDEQRAQLKAVTNG